MYRIKILIFGLVASSMFFASCDDDTTGGPGGTNVNAPNVTATLDAFSSSTVQPGQEFTITVDALSSQAQLKAIEVSIDGSSLTPEEFDNTSVNDSEEQNPQLLFGDEKDSFNWDFVFTAPSEVGDYSYEFEISDDDNLVTIESVIITVEGVLEVVQPTIDVMSAPTIESPANSLVSVDVAATMGTYDIASISVLEDGVLITDLSRIRFDNVDFDSNPLPIFSPQSAGFTESVIIRTIAGNHNYVIRITDTEDNSVEDSFMITETMTSTALQETFQFVLVSNASGAGLGGLDLDNGVAVSSSSVDAELRDIGIDLGLPNASNWIQKVEAVNGSALRIVNLSNLPDGFSYDGVTSKEEITDAYNSGADTNPSPVLQVGDLLAVASTTNIYLIEVEEVVVTTTDNNDYYTFNIKY